MTRRRLSILVTGAAGYIGSALVRALLVQGHQVTAVDSMLFGDRALTALVHHPQLHILRMDIRGLRREHLTGMQMLIDLAGLSSDLATELDPTWNGLAHHHAQVRLARLARSCGVSRHLLISSCDVYGRRPGQILNELTPPQPLTRLAHGVLHTEAAVLPLASDGFAPVVLRLGQVFGRSERMRFDLTINAMTLSALRLRRVTLDQGGQRRRAHLHVRDVVNALVAVLDAPVNNISRQIFDISHLTLSTAEIAEALRQTLGSQLRIVADGAAPDPHDLAPEGRKARDLLGFHPQVSLREGLEEVLAGLDHGAITDSPETHAARWVHEVLALGREIRGITAPSSGRRSTVCGPSGTGQALRLQ
ncbi:MAG: hypothetical protein RL654_37 [Pseudomonadota bacterium]|jgi:nucleoside-diphosphate-sugar epimerase